jgi:hypothetical protein
LKQLQQPKTSTRQQLQERIYITNFAKAKQTHQAKHKNKDLICFYAYRKIRKSHEGKTKLILKNKTKKKKKIFFLKGFVVCLCFIKNQTNRTQKKKKPKTKDPETEKQKKRQKRNSGIVLSPSFVWWVVENVSGKRRNLGVVWLNSFQ